MTFSRTDKLKAIAIVHIFETGKPFGDYAACVVLDDGAGISYGINQFTHRSGSLLAVVEKYLALGGAVGREAIAERLPVLKRTSKAAIEKLAADAQFKKALMAAAITREMRDAQEAVMFEKYLEPAVKECEQLGFVLPLSLAVVYDSVVHGSWEKIRDRVVTGKATEKEWITDYVRQRDAWLSGIARLKKTTYRTKLFLGQIATGRWELEMPMNVHGVRLTKELFETDSQAGMPAVPANSPVGPGSITAMDPSADADGTDTIQPESSNGRDGAALAEKAQPAEPQDTEKGKLLDDIEARVNSVAAKVDQAERIVVTTATRTDKAKSLWTTVAGTLWQMLWAVGGFLAGVPREVWLVVAVIAGALMLLFLYRQFVLGKLREERGQARLPN